MSQPIQLKTAWPTRSERRNKERARKEKEEKKKSIKETLEILKL